MGNRYKDAVALQKENEEKKLLQESAQEQYEDEVEKKYFEREALKEAARTKHAKFSTYKANVKKALLQEALTRICRKAVKNPTDDEIFMCEALVSNYVNDKDIDAMIESFKGKTDLLDNLRNTIIKHYTSIVENADENDEDSMIVTPDNLDNFFEDIDNTEDVDDASDIIRMRVANAEEEFVNRVEEDNQNLKTIIKDTSERVQAARPELDNEYGDDDNDSSAEDPDEDFEVDETDEIQQESVRFAKQKLYEANRRKPRNVFDRMVRSFTEASIKNPEFRDQYVGENGRADMDKIVGSVRCMYTMLEMVMSLRIENVDGKYIKETIESIK